MSQTYTINDHNLKKWHLQMAKQTAMSWRHWLHRKRKKIIEEGADDRDIPCLSTACGKSSAQVWKENFKTT